ncbi:unnamed protein product [Alopecurus aequalis]
MPKRGRRKAPPKPPPRLEYQASDGAWYGVRVTQQEGWLRVMYENFLEETDEWYEPTDLASPRDVAALRARLRVVSPPLDDARCGDLRPGQRLCVFCPMSDLDCKFFDAVLVSVKRGAHRTVDGKEQCACRFKVRWTEGPRPGALEEVGIDGLCCVQNSPVKDPELSEFLDRVTMSSGDGNGDATAAPHATRARLAP